MRINMPRWSIYLFKCYKFMCILLLVMSTLFNNKKQLHKMFTFLLPVLINILMFNTMPGRIFQRQYINKYEL